MTAGHPAVMDSARTAENHSVFLRQFSLAKRQAAEAAAPLDIAVPKAIIRSEVVAEFTAMILQYFPIAIQRLDFSVSRSIAPMFVDRFHESRSHIPSCRTSAGASRLLRDDGLIVHIPYSPRSAHSMSAACVALFETA